MSHDQAQWGRQRCPSRQTFGRVGACQQSSRSAGPQPLFVEFLLTGRVGHIPLPRQDRGGEGDIAGVCPICSDWLDREGKSSRSGRLLDKGSIYKILNNRVDIGEAVHKSQAYPGEHQGIIDHGLWDKVHAILTVSPRAREGALRAQSPALLKGMLFAPNGFAMTPTHTRRRRKL